MKRDTAWLLRRYRDGGAPDWRVQLTLERELNQLVEERHELRCTEGELRRYIPERLMSFDAATSRALQMKAERRFEEWMRENRKAQAELAELRRFVSVAAELASATEVTREVPFLLVDSLSNLPTPAILRRLQSLARQFLDQGEARKAQFVVMLLKNQAERLRFRRPQEPSAGLKSAFGELAARGETEAVNVVRRLMSEGYLDLAEKIVEDLEADLAVKDRKRLATETPWGSLGFSVQNLHKIRQDAESVSRSLRAWLEGESSPLETEEENTWP